MTPNRKALISVLLALSCFATGAANAHEIKLGLLTIMHPWCRQTSGWLFGYMKIANNGTQDDRLVKVTAEISDHVELSSASGIPIPAGQIVKIAPDEFRIAFLQVKSKPMANTSIRGSLSFEKAGTLQIDFEVEEPE